MRWNDELVAGNSLRAILGNVHNAEIVCVTKLSVASSVAVRVFVSISIIGGRGCIALFSNERTLNVRSRITSSDDNVEFVSGWIGVAIRRLKRSWASRASSIDSCCRSATSAIFGSVGAKALVAGLGAALNVWRGSNRGLKSGRYAVGLSSSGRGGSCRAGINDVFTDFTG